AGDGAGRVLRHIWDRGREGSHLPLPLFRPVRHRFRLYRHPAPAWRPAGPASLVSGGLLPGHRHDVVRPPAGGVLGGASGLLSRLTGGRSPAFSLHGVVPLALRPRLPATSGVAARTPPPPDRGAPERRGRRPALRSQPDALRRPVPVPRPRRRLAVAGLVHATAG